MLQIIQCILNNFLLLFQLVRQDYRLVWLSRTYVHRIRNVGLECFRLLGSLHNFHVSVHWTLTTIFISAERKQLRALSDGACPTHFLPTLLLSEVLAREQVDAHRSEAREHSLRQLGLLNGVQFEKGEIVKAFLGGWLMQKYYRRIVKFDGWRTPTSAWSILAAQRLTTSITARSSQRVTIEHLKSSWSSAGLSLVMSGRSAASCSSSTWELRSFKRTTIASTWLWWREFLAPCPIGWQGT